MDQHYTHIAIRQVEDTDLLQLRVYRRYTLIATDLNRRSIDALLTDRASCLAPIQLTQWPRQTDNNKPAYNNMHDLVPTA